MRTLCVVHPVTKTLFCCWHIIMKQHKTFFIAQFISQPSHVFMILLYRRTDLLEIISALTYATPHILTVTLDLLQNSIRNNFSHSSLVSFQIQVSHTFAGSKRFALQIPFSVPICTLQVIHNDHSLNSTCALICIGHPSDMQELSWMAVLTFLFYFIM